MSQLTQKQLKKEFHDNLKIIKLVEKNAIVLQMKGARRDWAEEKLDI